MQRITRLGNRRPAEMMPLRMSLFLKLRHLFKLYRQRKQIASKWARCYPEGRKNFKQVFSEMRELIWKYNCKYRQIINAYFDEGMHRVENPLSECALRWPEWTRLRYILDYTLIPEEELLLGANKINFKKALQKHGYPTAAALGLLTVKNDVPVLLRDDGSEITLDDCLASAGAIFVKPDNLSLGEGCARIYPTSTSNQYQVNDKVMDVPSLNRFIRRKQINRDALAIKDTSKETLLAEQLITNHPLLDQFHPQSLNTLRIVTMRTPGGGFDFVRAIMRFGCDGASIDNMSSGGVAVPVGMDGKLTPFGHRKDLSQAPFREHPNSGIVFENFEIPFWKEALEMVMSVRREICPGFFVIGFDVAITPNGPMLIEINKNSDFFQRAGSGGMRPYMNTWLRPLVDELLKGNPIPY